MESNTGRDSELALGRQTLDGVLVAELCTRIRAEHSIPIGITTELTRMP